MGYFYLSLAVIAEVIGTLSLKASDGFTNLAASIGVIAGYSIAFYFLALVLKTVPVGVAYALWAGAGIVLVTLVGAVMFKQVPDAAAVIGISLIVSGIVVMQLFSKTTNH